MLRIITLMSMILSCLNVIAHDLRIFDIPFKHLVGPNIYEYYASKEILYYLGKVPTTARPLLLNLEDLYERNNLSHCYAQESYKIPPIIHMIWLGSIFPAQFYKFRKSWIKHHPTWLHILWTDCPQDPALGIPVHTMQELDNYMHTNTKQASQIICDINNFKLYNQALFDQTTNYGKKSDIARYEILYRYGGLYVDTDFECIKSFDILHRSYDFFTGTLITHTCLQIPNGLIGASPTNGLLKKCMHELSNFQNSQTASWQVDIMSQTGPLFFTKMIETYDQLFDDSNIVLPGNFFYPLKKTMPESFAIHHWKGSWRHATQAKEHRRHY